MTLTKGLDLSHYQTSVNVGQLANTYNLGFMAFKATEGGSYVDPAFPSRWAAARQAQVPCRAAYHYAHPNTSLSAQVRSFINTVRPVDGDVLVLDLERGFGASRGVTNAFARGWAEGVGQAAPHCARIIYMGGGYAGTATGEGLADVFDWWWFPRYASMAPRTSWPSVFAPPVGTNHTGWTRPSMWQFTPAFAGKYDADVSPLTPAQIIGGNNMAGALTTADIPAIAAACAQTLLTTPLQNPSDPTRSAFVATLLRYTDAHVQQLAAALNADHAEDTSRSAALQSSLDGLQAALTAGLAQVSADAVAAIQQAIKDGVIKVDVTVEGEVQA